MRKVCDPFSRVDVLYPFIAFGVLVVVEYLVARAWVRGYYRFGLPVLRMRLEGVRLEAGVENKLATVANRNASVIVYQRLSDSEIAFRERGNANVAFRYTPVLHGLIRYVPEEGATYVIGWINAFAVVAVSFVAWLFFTSSRYNRPWELTIWFLAIFGIMYAIGVWRYRMVAKSLRPGIASASPPS